MNESFPFMHTCDTFYYPGELEGGGKRATDPIWSLKVFKIQKVVTKPDSPVVYYLLDGPKRGFVREELMVVRWGRYCRRQLFVRQVLRCSYVYIAPLDKCCAARTCTLHRPAFGSLG